MNTSDTLDKAADLIQGRGWRAGPGGWPRAVATSPLCLEGGIMAALGENFADADMDAFWACPAYRAVQSYLDLSHDLGVGLLLTHPAPIAPLWQWNDDPTRTAPEVIEVLRAAAMVERAREAAVEAVAV